MSESWLTRNHRPLIVLMFAGLVVARWLGWSVGIKEAEALEVLAIIKIVLGVYVGGRSAEKIARIAIDKRGDSGDD